MPRPHCLVALVLGLVNKNNYYYYALVSDAEGSYLNRPSLSGSSSLYLTLARPNYSSHLASCDPERELPLGWPETNPSRVRLDSNAWGPK